MPVTPVHTLPYPDADDPGGDWPAALADLAAEVDDVLGDVVPDSGVLGTLGITPGTGWTFDVNQHRTIGSWLYLYVRFQRTGAAIVANAIGDISDSLVATITTVAKRPAMPYVPGVYRASFTGGGVLIGSNGQITITSAHSTSEISTGHNLIVAATYTIP